MINDSPSYPPAKAQVFVAILVSFVLLTLFVGAQQASAATYVSGTISEDTTWTVADSPYVVSGSVTVSQDVTLTIEPGVVIKFSGTALTINGTLIADGTSSQPIYFTSLKDDSVGGDTNGDGSATAPSPWDWSGISFASTSINSILDNVVVRYGYNNISVQTSSLTVSNSVTEKGQQSGITIGNATPTITENVIRNNSIGISISSSSPIITNNTIQGNGTGLEATGTSNATITDNTIIGNTGYALNFEPDSTQSTISGNNISDNGYNGIRLSGVLTVDATWGNNAPYIIYRSSTWHGITVSEGITLTMEPGVVVKFKKPTTSVYIDVNGTLVADGTSSQPIYFTSLKDDSVGGDTNGDGSATAPSPWDWSGISFASTSINSILDNVVVRYGYNNISVQTSSLTVSNSVTEKGQQSGITIGNATPTITENVIRNNSIGISISSSSPIISNNTITGNGSYGVYNATTSIIVNAENNYWGDPSGPYDPSDDTATGGLYNPYGTGDKVSDYVVYEPWFTYDPNIKLSGNVYDANDHSLISGASVTLGSYSTTTNSYGHYAFDKINSGTYTMIVSKEGYFDYTTSINLTASTTRDVYLTADPGTCTDGALSGFVRDVLTNAGLPDVTVNLSNGFSALTNTSGYYDFPTMSPGSYTVSVSVANFHPYYHTINICGDTTQDIFLTKPETVYGPNTPSGYSQDPVNTATGNYIYNKKDLEIPGTGLGFVFERHYNSQCEQDGPLGFGWSHTYAATITVNPDSSVVTIQWGDGKTETWTPDGSDGFTPQYGVFDALIDNGDGTYTVKKRDLIRYNFDASGMLSSVVDKSGNTISMTYAGNDLVQITDTVGRNINLTHDVNGRITQIADPIGRTIQFVYDGNGDLVSSTDMNGNTTTYTYDANHQILIVIDPRGNTVVTNTYDDEKRVVTSQRDAKGGQTTYAYDEVNKKTTLTDALGYTTIHFHDELLRLIQETDDKSDSAYFTYDEQGNRTEVKNKNANKTTYTYDANGNVLTKTDVLGKATTITYNANNNPLTRMDALSNTTTYEYDANGNLIKATDPLGNLATMTYNACGQPLTITDARGNTTTNSYDAEGNLIEVTDALGNKTTYTYDGVGRRLTFTNALGEITSYTYDNNDNLLTVTDPLGNVTTHIYDQNNNRLTTTDPMVNTTTYAYDVKDLLSNTTDPLSNSITNAYDGLDRKTSVTDKRGYATTFSYDAVGNLLTMTDPLGNSTTYAYDANGNQLTNTNPLGHTVTYAYDSLDRQTSATDPLGNSTTTTYDAIGRVTAETNAKGQTTSFEYDAIGRLTKVIDDEGGTIIYTYDENGNRLTMKDSNENTTTYTYDALNRLTQKVEPLGNAYQYAYDAVGNMTSMTDANGNSIIYTYDANNRLIEIKYPDDSKVTFTYDANGNKIQMVDSLGTTSYAYDALNRMVSYTDPFGKTVAYGYDANGNRTLLTYPDGKIVSYAYDALNRLATVSDWLTRETIYTYDAAGNLIGALNPNNTKVSYTYDDTGRLTELSNTKSDFSVISSYVYTLDAIGNHTSVAQNEPLAPILASQNIAYTYDAENRLTSAGDTTYTYDANGNLTGNGSDTFTYDYEDRLVQSNIGGADTQYGYDGLGNRLEKRVDSTTTRYVLDINASLSNVLAETDNAGTIMAYYVYGLGLISKILPDGTTYNYHYDSRGSTVALTDVLQNTTDTYTYDSFGNVANSSGSTQNPFKHVGRYGVMNEENGLNYIRARYYSPEVGRFITKDPQTGNDRDGKSLNRYVYALNNPVVLIDISGLSAQEGGVDRNNQQSSDEIHKQILDEYQQNLTNEYLQDLIIALGGKVGGDFAKQLQLYALKYGDLKLGTGSLDVGGLGYVLEKGFDFLTLAKLAKGFGTELGRNWDNPSMHWTEKWGRATMGITVHSTLSAINIGTGGLSIPLTTGAGIAYDKNIDSAWNWLQSSKGINWLGGGFYHLGLY